jgi:hypothetical protein
MKHTIFVRLFYGVHPRHTVLAWNWLFTRQLIRWVKRYAHPAPGGLRVALDYGCGKLPYYPWIAPRVDAYYALDFPEQLRRLPAGDNVFANVRHVALAPDGGIPPNAPQATLLLSFQVLMEVDNPQRYLDQLAAHAAPGATLLLTTPWGMLATGHNDRCRLSPYAVHELLRRAGFEMQRYQPCGYFFTAAALSLNFLLVCKNRYRPDGGDRVAFSPLRALLFAPLVALCNAMAVALDALLPLRRAPANYAIIARKSTPHKG